jgi:hypothetical protein
MAIGMVLSRIPWRKIPWVKILQASPAIVEAAHKLLETIATRTQAPREKADLNTRVDQIDQKIADLQSNEAKQAELNSLLAKQAQRFSDGMHMIAESITWLLWISVAALLLALAVAVKEFLF